MILNNGVHSGTIQNNYFGTDITGTLPLPNRLAILLNTADTTDVSSAAPGRAKATSSRSTSGSAVRHGIWNFGQRITVRGNSIYDNEASGFDIDGRRA